MSTIDKIIGLAAVSTVLYLLFVNPTSQFGSSFNAIAQGSSGFLKTLQGR